MNSLPPIIQNAILEVHKNIQSPYHQILSSALGTIALACQGSIDVCRPDGHIGPCSLALITVAATSERKTTGDNIFTQPIREFENKSKLTAESAKLEYSVELALWQCELKRLNSMITTAMKEDAMNSSLRETLKTHIAKRPIRTYQQKLILRDATPEAIAWAMQGDNASAGLISNEAGPIFNGPATGTKLPMFSELWNGDDLFVDRRSSESFTVKNPRFTISLMVQPKTFQKFLDQRGQLARDNGFLARCLFAWPASTQGNRPIQSIERAQWPKVTEFHARITEILNAWEAKRREPNFQRTIVEFSPDAKVDWTDFANFIEGHLNWGGAYYEVRDAAAKVAEQVCRMSALLHFFEGRSGDIQRDTLHQAIRICEGYLFEFKRIFCPPPPIPQHEQDAMALDAWLRQLLMTRNVFMCKKNVVRQFGPNPLRNKARLNSAINTLIWSGRIRIFLDEPIEQKSRTSWIELIVNSPPYQPEIARPLLFPQHQNIQIAAFG